MKLETPNIVVSFGEGIAKFSVNFIENYTLGVSSGGCSAKCFRSCRKV